MLFLIPHFSTYTFQGIQLIRTSISRNIAVQSAEHHVALVFKLLSRTFLYDQLAHCFRHGQALLPAYRILVFLARTAWRGTNGGEDEVRVKGEEEDEALAYATCCAEDACKYQLKSVIMFNVSMGFNPLLQYD